MHRHRLVRVLATIGLAGAAFRPAPADAQAADTVRVEYSARRCPHCAEWNAPHAPFRIYGNTYYVGTDGLSAILITSDAGHVLIDGGVPMSAPRIIENIAALGFKVSDVKLILNSHAHYDHAGGIAALQRASGARVAASPWSAKVISRGEADDADPQYGLGLPYPAASNVRVIADGETLRVGPLALTAHFTGGHTPGGTSWSWQSCDAGRCLDLVYADSQTPVSADTFLFTRSRTYPNGPSDFEHGLSTLEHLKCDILLTPHPGVVDLFERTAAGTLVDPSACARFVAAARQDVAKRMERERTQP